MDNLGAKILQPITDPKKLSQIQENINKAMYSKPISGLSESLIIVKIENWIAVPTLNFPDTALILECKEQTQLNVGDGGIYGVVLPIFGCSGLLYAYEVPSTIEGIQEFDYILASSPFSPVLFSGESKLDWIIASMESEFHVVAGPSETVEYLLGCTAEESFAHFSAFIAQFNSSESESQLSRMFNRYYSFVYDNLSRYKYASAGSELLLTLS